MESKAASKAAKPPKAIAINQSAPAEPTGSVRSGAPKVAEVENRKRAADALSSPSQTPEQAKATAASKSTQTETTSVGHDATKAAEIKDRKLPASEAISPPKQKSTELTADKKHKSSND